MARSSLISSILLLFFALSVAQSVSAAELDESCDGRQYGVKDQGELAQFDSKLRHALERSDSAQLAALVSYPLRVNGPGRGSYVIPNPRTLQEQFLHVFPPQLKAAVLGTPQRDVSCMSAGVMYGDGALWIQPVLTAGRLSYRIQTINLPGESQPALRDGHLLEFVCETAQHRVIVDYEEQSNYRYRAWNKPHAITEKPDIEITSGSQAFEGTGQCGHQMWIFTRGNTRYTVSELGCTDGSESYTHFWCMT
jgi:hypothetical protein